MNRLHLKMSYRTTNGEYGKQAMQATNDSELPETGYVSIKHAMRELVNARRIPHEAVDMSRFTDLNVCMRDSLVVFH